MAHNITQFGVFRVGLTNFNLRVLLISFLVEMSFKGLISNGP